ncbi:hypothetical protein BREU_0384 [Bifidobacterium reuteri DSM 23975]|uniref:Uncharacterized protein n=1 Tax=Bifidobacterium reuteri DSM 23975 TaxID=1437610 RepID=A0A087CYD0_9BIFI|nr:hypothetical protein BREU_0384 [Bifidobacterium reuteri DSM 23975]
MCRPCATPVQYRLFCAGVVRGRAAPAQSIAVCASVAGRRIAKPRKSATMGNREYATRATPARYERYCSGVARDERPHRILHVLGEAKRPLCALMASLSAMQRSHQDVNRPAAFTENTPRSETVITCPADFTSFSYQLTRPRCRFSVSRPAQSHSAGLRVSSAAKPRSSRLIAPIIAIQRGGTSVGPWRCPGHCLSAGQYPGRVGGMLRSPPLSGAEPRVSRQVAVLTAS